MKKIYGLWAGIILLVLAAGCAKAESDEVTIQKNPESDYQKTFQDLALGELNEYEIQFPKDADLEGEIFVEVYENGVMQENTSSLSLDWEEKEQEGTFGVGYVTSPMEEPSMLLFSQSGTLRTQQLEETKWKELSIRGWQDAVNGDELTLKHGKEYILGAYKGTTGNETRMYDLTAEEELEEMLNEHELVLLFKIRIDENEQN
ncbi:hypothetical protein ACGTN9_11470 [Halobacillus sp. MO56]